MATNWFHPRDLPTAYRALLDPNREISTDVYLAASLPSFNVRLIAALALVPVSGFWVVYAIQRLITLGRFTDVMGILFWVVSAFFAGGIALKALESLRYAMRARVHHRRGLWRHGIFMHKDWLLIRNEAARVLLIPRKDVRSIYIKPARIGPKSIPQIEVSDQALNNHPFWNALWPQIEDPHIADRLKDWLNGRNFHWLANGSARDDLDAKSWEPAEEASDKEAVEEEEYLPHIPSLPPHALSLTGRLQAHGPSSKDFLDLENEPLLYPSSGPLISHPTLVPDAPDEVEKVNRRVAPPPARAVAHNTSPTPVARDRIREVLAHAVKSTKLDLSGCRLTAVPADITQAQQITYLDLSNNDLDRIPAFVTELPQLEVLDISGNPALAYLPKSIGRLNNLRHIQADLTGFEYFPWEVTVCRSLTHLVLPGEPFNRQTRDEITKLMPYARIEFVGASIEEEASINMPFRQLIANEKADAERQEDVAINLSRQNLGNLNIDSLAHSRVVTLNASHNQIKELPVSIAEMQSLQVLLLDYNELEALPEGICELQKLEWLSVTNNRLQQLPRNIGQLKGLSQLILYGNKFNSREQERIKASFPNLEIIF